MERVLWNYLSVGQHVCKQPEAVVRRCPVEKVFLGISQNSQELRQSLFFNNVAGLRSTTLLKKRLWRRCFPVNFAKFLRTTFFTEHLRWLLLNSFSQNWLIGFFWSLHEGRVILRVRNWQSRIFQKKFQKFSFWDKNAQKFLKNRFFLAFAKYLIWYVLFNPKKVHSSVLYDTAKTPCLGEILFFSYGWKYSQPVKFQYSLIINISGHRQ